MPAYDYDCAACGGRFEVTHGVHADPPPACLLCGRGPVRKAITAAAIHYKGSGWAKKERRAKASSGSRSSDDGTTTSDDGAKSDAAKADAAKSDAGKSDEGAKSDEGRKSGSGASETAKPAPSKAAEAGATSKAD
jgi:putative FmdB family regulatory protein